MKIHKRFKAMANAIAFVAGVAVLLAACSSSGSNASATTSGPGTNSGANGSNVLMTKSSPYGNIIVDQSSITLYMLTADTSTKSVCTGGCLSIWPPVIYSSSVSVRSPLKKSLVGEITLSNGSRQLTYNGHPLYTYSGDTNSGQYNGQGLSFPTGASNSTGHWYVIGRSGNALTATANTSSSGGYSYG